jgi:osmotically-inducible protein OsmY
MKTDEQLRADVIDELKWNPRIKSAQIGAIVKDGAVTLTGVVETFAERMYAERAAKGVKGVRALADDIEVKLRQQTMKTDEDIAEQAARMIAWTSTLRDTNVQAEVHSGRVTLTGEVDWLYQKELAAKRVAEFDGVTGVFNQITVRACTLADVRDVKRQIMGALHRHANVEASKIAISVANGTVTLDGTVDAYHERGLIEDAARGTEGVREVIDNVRVL